MNDASDSVAGTSLAVNAEPLSDYHSTMRQIADILAEIRAPGITLRRVMELQGRLMRLQRERMEIFEALNKAEREAL